MIIYNNRYRGPYEYDKFALNILSLHNMVEELKTYEFENTNENINSLINLYNDLNELFNLLCYKNSYDEKIYEIIIKRDGIYSDT